MRCDITLACKRKGRNDRKARGREGRKYERERWGMSNMDRTDSTLIGR